MKIATAGLTLLTVLCEPHSFEIASAQTSAANEPSVSGKIISDRHLACKRREDAENLIHFVPTADLPTFKDYVLELLLSRRCIVLEKGAEVLISQRGAKGETLAVRKASETEFLYVDRYDVQ